MKPTTFLAVVGLTAIAAPAMANHLFLVEDAGVDLNSSYVSRGSVVADRATLQPTLSLTVENTPLAVDVWGSFTMQDRQVHSTADELDITVSAGQSVGKLDVSAGVTHYNFTGAPTGSQFSQELCVCCEQSSGLAANANYFYDFGLLDSSYATIGIAPSLTLNKSGSLALSFEPTIGFGDLGQSFGFQDATFAVSTGFDWSGLALSPSVGYSYGSEAANPDGHGFWTGLGIRFAQ